MKGFLVFLVIILIGLVFWVRHVSVRPTEAHREIIAGLKEELKQSELEHDRLVAELAQVKAALKAKVDPAERPVSPSFESISGSTAPAPRASQASVSPITAPAGDLQGRLRQLGDIYHANHAELLKKMAAQESTQDVLRAKRISVTDRPMNFSELSTVTDAEGNITSIRGVRTSDADRTRAIAKRDEEIAQIDAEIKKIAVDLAGTEAEIKRLDELYQNAIAKAKAEFGGR